MPYLIDDSGNKIWSYTDRDQVINWFSDQLRTAAERLARHTEEYLFDDRSPNYRDDVFLSWAVAQYDSEKSGSGSIVNFAEYDPDVVATTPFIDGGPDGTDTVLAGRTADTQVRLRPEAAELPAQPRVKPPAKETASTKSTAKTSKNGDA